MYLRLIKDLYKVSEQFSSQLVKSNFNFKGSLKIIKFVRINILKVISYQFNIGSSSFFIIHLIEKN